MTLKTVTAISFFSMPWWRGIRLNPPAPSSVRRDYRLALDRLMYSNAATIIHSVSTDLLFVSWDYIFDTASFSLFLGIGLSSVPCEIIIMLLYLLLSKFQSIDVVPDFLHAFWLPHSHHYSVVLHCHLAVQLKENWCLNNLCRKFILNWRMLNRLTEMQFCR